MKFTFLKQDVLPINCPLPFRDTLSISTDVIVGFPGETLEDFELTKNAFMEAGFEMGFIFKYSDRSGTPSVSLDRKVEKSELERRNQELLKILENQSLSSNQKLHLLDRGKPNINDRNLLLDLATSNPIMVKAIPVVRLLTKRDMILV